MKPYLSIIIPNYNEKKNLERGVLQDVANYLKTAKFSWEVIISDDEATDGSREMIESFVKGRKGFFLLKNPHGGKASAIYAGLQKARGEVVLFSDMDQSTPLSEVEKLLPHYKEGCDVVFGSRGGMRKNAPLVRRISAYSFLTFRRLLLLPQIRDTQCGFKSMRTKVAKKIFPQMEVIQNLGNAQGWSVSAYDVELLHLAQKKGYKLKEIPVQWQDEDTSNSKNRGSKFIKESIDMLKQILRVKLRDLTGTYA